MWSLEDSRRSSIKALCPVWFIEEIPCVNNVIQGIGYIDKKFYKEVKTNVFVW